MARHIHTAKEERPQMKTSELTGTALDWAVAICENVEPDETNRPIWFGDGDERVDYTPSTNCAQGGPIIEREKIATAWHITRWVAWRGVTEHPGPTPLVAAMRCRVASELGDEVEIPNDLS